MLAVSKKVYCFNGKLRKPLDFSRNNYLLVISFEEYRS